MNIEKFLPTKEMQAEFEEFKTLKTPEEIESFKQRRKARYDALADAEKEIYKMSAKSGINATIEACNNFIDRADRGNSA